MEKKYLLLGLMAILLANPASSQDCPTVEPTCDEMGYVNTLEECDGKQIVRCPFDTTKLFCGGASGSCPDGKIEVNELCYPNYDSCEAAGYYTTSQGCGTVKIYVKGEETTCYIYCCPDGYYKIDGNCRKTYANCSAAGYSDDDTGCGAVIIYVDSGASFQKKICYNSKCCKPTEVDDGGVCTPYYSSCAAAGAAQTPAKNLQSTANDCPVDPQYWIGVAPSNAEKTTCYDADCCEGADKCLYNNQCVTCYSSCSAYNSTYKDSQPSGYTCSSASVIIGAGNGATATSKDCYYDCTKDCSGKGQCMYNGQCVTCYKSCSDVDSSYVSAIPDGQNCISHDGQMIGSGYGAEITSLTTCYSDCSDIDPCPTDSSCCKYTHRVKNPSTRLWETVTENVTCYRNCQEVNSDYLDAEPENYSCSSNDFYIGSGYAGEASVTQCYYDCSCSLTAATCAATKQIANTDNCACEDCPNNQTFDEEGMFCRTCEGKQKEGTCAANETFVPYSKYEDGTACGDCTCGLDTAACATEGKTFNSETCACEACPNENYTVENNKCICSLNAAKCAENKQIFDSATCSCEDCPNNQTFDEDGNFCRTCEGKQKEGTCAVGENFVEWSKYEDGTACGDCVNCLDESNQNNPCVKKGIYKYTCQGGGRYPIGESKCECGTVPYYTKCGIEEQCFEENYPPKKENGGSCKRKVLEDSTYITKSGYYPVRYDCTRNTDAKKVYWVAECDTPKDCDGNHGPAYGLKTCDKGTGIGEPFMCGGEEWYESCDPCQEQYYVRANGGECYEAALEGSYYDDANGMYRAGEKCTRADGKKVYYIARCNIEKDCMGNPGLVAGLQDCRSINSEGVGDPVECRGRNFYESCDTCRSFEIKQNTDNGGLCDIYTEEGGAHDNDNGHYRVKEKCTQTTTGKKVYWVAECNVAKDCAGHVPEAAGLKQCERGEFGYGKVVQCGGYTYADKCLTECNYEKTEADCTAEGKSFVLKCVDNKGQSWGECS